MRILAALIVGCILPLSFAGTAEATRPIPGYPYRDMCRNIPGKQPIYMLYGTGPYRFVNKEARICGSRTARW